MRALLDALADPNEEVGYNARNQVRYLLEQHPGLDLTAWLAKGLLTRLIEQERWEALEPFAQDPLVLQAWLELAVQGSARTCDLLPRQIDRLDEKTVDRLCAG